MRKQLFPLLMMGVLVAGCGGGSFSVSVTFPDEAARQASTAVRIAAIDALSGGNCPDLIDGTISPESLAIEDDIRIELGTDGPGRALDLLSKGPKLFYAEAENTAGQIILRGCTPVEAGGNGVGSVTIALQWPSSICEVDADCDDDGRYCNGTPRCDAGDCVEEAPDCDDQVDCTLDSCDEDADACVNTPSDTRCDDGHACTLDTCSGTAQGCDHLPDNGLCPGGELCVVDAGCQVVSCTIDSECDDGVYCNGIESCGVDSCQGGLNVDCDDGIACTVDTCDEGTQACANNPDDGLCAVSETCEPASGGCITPPCTGDPECDDGVFCNGIEICDAGTCIPGIAADCDDVVPCTLDSCDPIADACASLPDHAQCVPGELCDSVTGCGVASCTEDSDCDDGRYCNGLESCNVDTCDFGMLVGCDDGVACTIDQCDEATDSCLNVADNAQCDNGVFCDGAEACDDLTGCQPGTTPACDDGVSCTVDSCELVGDSCANAPDDGACANGTYCDGDEVCDALADCQPGPARDCSDGVGCTVDSCDEPSSSCSNVPDNGPCLDGDVCNGDETCVPGVGCQPGSALVCDDGVFCNGDETCDPASGCGSGAPRVCDDGIPCTDEVCDAGQDMCVATPNTAGGCPTFHIGPAANTCPHLDATGGATDACDYTGIDGLMNAVAAAPVDGAAFLLYDDLGAEFMYETDTDPLDPVVGVPIPGGSYVAAAPGVDPDNVILTGAPLMLAGDGIHLERLTLLIRAGSETAISAWVNEDTPPTAPGEATGGHLIENIKAYCYDVEVIGANSIGEPVQLGPDTTVRNSLFVGFWEFRFMTEFAFDSRMIHNTFVFYQAVQSSISAAASDGFTFANNVVLSLGRIEPVAAVADLATTRMTIAGNVLEGFAGPITGHNPGDPSIVVQDNIMGPAEMESPYNPLFLADASQTTGSTVPGEGVSLDGVPIDGQTGILPGCFQQRSARTGPRRMVVRVGDGDCGGNACDFDQSEDSELQKAVWSSWAGGTVEIYPSANPYCGFALIHLPITVRGMGAQPEDVTLLNIYEDPLLHTYLDAYYRHDGVMTVLQHIEQPVVLENFHLVVDGDPFADNHGVMIEPRDPVPTAQRHVVRRVRFGTAGTQEGAYYALYLDDQALVQDVLIDGEYNSCIRFGPRRSETQVPSTTADPIVNLSCRLTGTTAIKRPVAAFEVAEVDGGVFVNLAVEMTDPAPLFKAQERSGGTIDRPVSFEVHAATVRGITALYDGFNDTHGTYVFTGFEELLLADPFFESAADSHLAAGCTAIDSGVDPAMVSVDLSVGVSLDGIPHPAASIDRGCFEQ